MDEMLIAFGSEIKALGEGRIGGYLVRFTNADDPDLEGEFFSAQTDFGIHTRLPLYYAHGQDGYFKTRRIGEGQFRTDDAGLWYEAQLNLRDEYERHVAQLIEAGKAGFSSGALGHLIEREPVGKSTWLKTWIIGEASVTPQPAEYRNQVLTLKSLKELENYDPMEDIGESMTQAALCRLNDTLLSCMMVCCFDDTQPFAKRLTTLRGQFDQTRDLALSTIKERVMAGEGAATAKGLLALLHRLGQVATERDFEDTLRDAGYSRSEAVKHAACIYKALCQRESEERDAARLKECATYLHLLELETDLLIGA